LPLTDNSDLHLLVDGARVKPRVRNGAVSIFHLDVPRDHVRIVSRASVPAEIGVARDERTFGAALQRMVVAASAGSMRRIRC
jgi:hypothetical protein